MLIVISITGWNILNYIGMAGKVSDEQMFEVEKRMKRFEIIIGAMSEEERSDPDLVARMVRAISFNQSRSSFSLVFYLRTF